ncbi:MAG: hypothetical protein K6T88_15420 [Bacillus sp. (in: Bacteria)]|nr:hypothetical protein [Bacillus sp. (in: firmicutes)]
MFTFSEEKLFLLGARITTVEIKNNPIYGIKLFHYMWRKVDKFKRSYVNCLLNMSEFVSFLQMLEQQPM